MKNILSVVAALVAVSGVANAQGVLNTTVTVDTDPSVAKVLNSAGLGVTYGRDSERTETAVTWDLEAFRGRVLSVPVNLMTGFTFGNSVDRNVGLFAGVGFRVFRVLGTDVRAGVGWGMPVVGDSKWVLEGEPRFFLGLKR